MCEECETPNALHLSYAEKRARIRAVWQPAGKARMGFMATCAPATPAAGTVNSVQVRPAANSDKGAG